MSSQRSYSFSRQVLVNGIRDGIPIVLGYFAVSFSLGIAARKAGLSPFQGFLASLFNNASAGEYAAFTLIAANAGYLQVAIITLIANARYLLMSCALAQRFSPDTPFFHRFLIGYDVTDELFGSTIARPGWRNPYYTYGAILVAAPAWSIGTALGIIAGNLLPLRAVSALSVALYGIDYLIKAKQNDFANCGAGTMTEEVVRQREEISMLISALKGMQEMAADYGIDNTQPAANAKEAVQWLYFGYLAAIKTQNGAAMSVGRVSTFLDIYIQRDLDNGTLTESEAQELIDHMVMKFRMVKFARIPSYNQLFSGDPVWATLEVGGIGMDGRSMVTKNCYRFLHTLENMGPAPEPNLTVLYSSALPENFKKYAAKVSINTCSVQYENDDVMKPVWGDDYSICCCVSATQTGKEMQFFGARANLAKCLLYAINGGVDEKSHEQCGPNYAPITGEYLNYDEELPKYVQMLDWLAGLYVNVLNLIQYMHDKYYYEAAEMALIDTDVRRTFATGIAGFSHVVDSLSAIKYAKVKCIRNEQGLVTDYEIEGDFPKYGNNDDRVDSIAVEILDKFMDMIRSNYCYRGGVPTTSILTITSNVVYGKKTGNTPDGRKKGQPLAPGANPMHGRDTHGAAASMASVAKLPWKNAQDGISNTFTIIPDALGKDSAVFAGDIDVASIREEMEKQ